LSVAHHSVATGVLPSVVVAAVPRPLKPSGGIAVNVPLPFRSSSVSAKDQ